MKITKKTSYFRDVEIGNVFICDDEPHLKTEPFRIGDDFRNAVCLVSNYITYFEDDEPVIPMKGELIIY